ncbi:FAD-binding oxidoreductase [Microbacterium sp. K41]|uniref:FAD-binding oxidoreductase n=1 Tax=Microbacterium sp. K41 TaxID=2305437 RepID=UPI00109CCFA1|nr:FAD-dependent oxidoreductase [Microbacterium sp. K41]
MSTNLDVSLVVELRAAGVSHAYAASDPEYTSALLGFNRDITHTPELVVVPQSSSDVTATVTLANRHGLPVQVLGKGHGAQAAVTEGIAIATDGLAFVEVDPAARTARVGAGATWTDVLDAATPHGLAALCGSAPHVGVVGYLLGGGIGPVARTFGFAADHVRWINVVTADGGLVRADAEFNQDLFWALRGGKGGFGVVVEVEIDLFPLSTLYGGALYYAAEDAAAVLRTFAEWSHDLPDEMTTSVAMLRLPPLPELPEPLRGRFVCAVRIGYVGAADDAEALMAPLREVARPLIDAVGVMPYQEIGRIHADPVNPMPVMEGGILLHGFTAAAADALLAVAGPNADVPLAAVEVRLLGGALARTPEPDNAVGGRGAAYSLHVVGAPVPELLHTVIPEVIDTLFTTMGGWRSLSTQINFFGRANRPIPGVPVTSWAPDVAARLREVRRKHDPAGRFPYPLHGEAI